MLVQPREYTSAREIIENARSLRAKLRPMPRPEPSPPPPVIVAPPPPEPEPEPVKPPLPFSPSALAQFEETWRPAPAGRIRKMVADKFGLTIAEIINSSHSPKFAIPRRIAMYLCSRHAGLSRPATGRFFGDKDHTTVLHAVRCMDRDLPNDPLLARVVAEFAKEIEGWS